MRTDSGNHVARLDSERLQSVWLGRDGELLNAMFSFYAPTAERIVDVCCNSRRMWSTWAVHAVGYDIDPSVKPDVVCGWSALPDADGTVDVLVYDPPHLPLAAATDSALAHFVRNSGWRAAFAATIRRSCMCRFCAKHDAFCAVMG